MKLHLGCFDKKIPGYLDIDIRAEVNPDICDDIFTLEKIQNDSVDSIYVCHALEHLKRNQIIPALSRWYEILKNGGVLRISVPDMQAVFEHYIYHKNLPLLYAFLGGSQKHDYDYHYSHFDYDTLRSMLKLVGFRDIDRYDRWTTEHAHIDDYSAAYLPHKDFENGRLMSLNIEAHK